LFGSSRSSAPPAHRGQLSPERSGASSGLSDHWRQATRGRLRGRFPSEHGPNMRHVSMEIVCLQTAICCCSFVGRKLANWQTGTKDSQWTRGQCCQRDKKGPKPNERQEAEEFISISVVNGPKRAKLTSSRRSPSLASVCGWDFAQTCQCQSTLLLA